MGSVAQNLFSTVVGVYFTLAINLAVNVMFIVAAVMHLIYLESDWAYAGSNLPLETCVAGFMLAGVPIIIAGFVGTYTKSEILLRVYWYYLAVLYVLTLIWVICSFVVPMSCNDLPSLFQDRVGKSFICGMRRIFDIVCIVILVLFPPCLMLIVNSHCDHLASDVQVDLSMIAASKGSDRVSRPWLGDENRARVDSYLEKFSSANYGAAQNFPDGWSTGQRIFNGNFHDMSYPASNA